MESRPPRRRRPSFRTLAFVATVVVSVAVTLAVLGGFGRGASAPAGAAAAPAAAPLTQSLRDTLGLARVPASPKAPLFSLVDQHGRHVSLAALRGKVVVLEPMDPHCTDLCPIVSREFVVAAHKLGADAKQVVFLGINVNQFHERPADVNAFSLHHGLDTLADWHFLTGSTAALKRVWQAYGISVKPNKTGDVVHSALMWFVDPQGRMRWVATPTYDKAQIPRFGAGIATVAARLLG